MNLEKLISLVLVTVLLLVKVKNFNLIRVFGVQIGFFKENVDVKLFVLLDSPANENCVSFRIFITFTRLITIFR